MPAAPMLASPAGTLPPLEDWTIEPKWDGIRVIAELTRTRVRLWSRNGIDKAAQFPDVRDALLTLAQSTGPLTLDGEVVAIDRAGAILRFQSLQTRADRTGRDARTALVVFDLLAAGTRSLLKLPWTERRAALEIVIPKTSRGLVRRGDSARCGTAAARKLLAAATRDGWEGVIVKQLASTYTPGKRSPHWRKVKLEHEQEFVIGGYSLPTDGADRSHFGALLVGYYKDGKLRYAGRVGTGYTRATLASLGGRLEALRQPKSSFVNPPKSVRDVLWVKPVLVAQVRYNELTAAGVLRQPAFLGLRDDKAPRKVSLETETSHAAILAAFDCG